MKRVIGKKGLRIQPIFACSVMFKVNNKDTRTTCSRVSIAYFEYVKAGWEYSPLRNTSAIKSPFSAWTCARAPNSRQALKA